ncbi:MAG: helix-turn-helix domain-containing protein [Bacteroidales bacterium]|nr:helix-turn-helix domain-containing protein [Bacteroidales bacterium]
MEDIKTNLERIEFLLLIANKSVFDISEAARFLGLSEARLYHLTASKEIPHYKKGKAVYFKKAELEGWMTEKRVLTNDEIMEKAQTMTL